MSVASGKKTRETIPSTVASTTLRGTGGGGNYFKLYPLYDDLKSIEPWPGFYATDVFADWGAQTIRQHQREHAGQPFFLHLCFTAPHFPLQAHPVDIARHRGEFKIGWDELRKKRFARQKSLGLMDSQWSLSPRDPIARAWSATPEADKDEWDLRMSVHAGMIECMDRGIARVLDEIRQAGLTENTVVIFFSDNGASAEALNSYPNPRADTNRAASPALPNRIAASKLVGPMRPTRRFASTRCGCTKAEFLRL